MSRLREVPGVCEADETMLGDVVATVGVYASVFLGAILLLWIAIHAYAWWTIRDIDRTESS